MLNFSANHDSGLNSNPEACLKIAQRFGVGWRRPWRPSPEGTAETSGDFCRPSGTLLCVTSGACRSSLVSDLSFFARGLSLGRALLSAQALKLALVCLAVVSLTSCGRNNAPFVVVYTSQDQVYSEPILNEFTRQTAIEVRAVYDSEAVKTVGLANRLLNERAHPQCDVFWNNEELRTQQLAAQGLFRATNGWQAVGYRSRRLVINTNRLSLAQAPRSLVELTNSAWSGKVALAYPLFGTTATHFLALRQAWGNEAWLNWCRALNANKPFLVDGNSVVVNLVGRGEAWIGLTDSDDIAAGQREGLPVLCLPMGPDSLLIPNTIAVLRDCPHPENAQALFDYLCAPSVLQKLIAAHALEAASIGADFPPTLHVNWAGLLADLEQTTSDLKAIFLR